MLRLISRLPLKQWPAQSKTHYRYVSNISPTTSESNRKSVDETNQNIFAGLSDWWDIAGSIRLLHLYNAIRIPYIRDAISPLSFTDRQKPLKGMKVLDIGCGGGIVSEPLVMLGADVTGVDTCKEMIALAKDHAKTNLNLETRPNYICSTIEDHVKNHEDFYDSVVASEVIDHVTDPASFLKDCVKTLKPGGTIVVTAPNRTSITQFFGIFVAEDVLGLVPKGTHKHEKFVTPEEVTEVLQKYNCTVNNIQGSTIDLFQWRWKLSDNQDFMYLLTAVKNV